MMASDDVPFASEIKKADAKTVPVKFHGRWRHSSEGTETIHADQVDLGLGWERVIAVRYIGRPQPPLQDFVFSSDRQDQIALLTLSEEGDSRSRYLALSTDGSKLIDLESMDWVLERC